MKFKLEEASAKRKELEEISAKIYKRSSFCTWTEIPVNAVVIVMKEIT